MFTKNSKVLAMAAVAVIAAPLAAKAATTSIDATALFRAAITLGNEVTMAFGTIDFVGTPAGTDTAAIGTDGNITFAGNFSGAATGTAGSVDITAGASGATLQVQCDSSATMAEAGGETINVNSIEWVAEGSEAASGSGNACAGVGSSAGTFVLNPGTLDTIKFGGTIDGNTASGGFTSGAYSTATGGGDAIDVTVIYN